MLLTKVRKCDIIETGKKEELRKMKRKSICSIAVAFGVLIVLIAASAIIVPHLKSRSANNGDSSAPDQTRTDPDTVSELPPWVTGQIRLTSLVYGKKNSELQYSSGKSSETANLSSRQNIVRTSDQNRASNTLTLSIAQNTKISAFSGSDLIRVRLSKGEHAGCDSVWYNVRTDSTVCLSCLIRDAISETPEYIDACIRLAIESGMIPPEAVYAGDCTYEYSTYYRLMNNEGAYSVFSSGKHPKLSSVGLSGNDIPGDRASETLKNYVYPSVCVLEYGEDPGKCLFILTNSDKTLSYGSFIFDFESRTAVKLGKQYAGDPRCYSGAYGDIDGREANLALASEILIRNDYTRIIAMVPFFLGASSFEPRTGKIAPGYSASTVMVYVAGDTYSSIIGNNLRDVSAILPVGGLRESNGTIAYLTSGGETAFSVNGSPVFCVAGKLLVLAEGSDGRPAALMETDGKTTGYVLTEEAAEQIGSEDILSVFKPLERYRLEGSVITDLVTKKEKRIADSDPLAYVSSHDGRYAYLYFGKGYIRCCDILTGDVGAIPVSEEFESQIHGTNGITLCLFLNSRGDELLLAYYKEGQLTFDVQGYLEAIPQIRETHRFYGMYSSDSVRIFNHNIETVLDYYKLDGKPVKITEISNFKSICRFLSVGIYEKKLTPKMTQGNYNEIGAMMSSPEVLAEIAEAVIPYMDYTESEAYVTAAALRDAMNGITADAFNEKYDDLIMHFDGDYQIINGDGTPELWLHNLSRFIANDLTRLFTGYFASDCLDRDVILRQIEYSEEAIRNGRPGGNEDLKAWLEELDIFDAFCEEFNKGIDKEESEKLRVRLTEIIMPLLPDPLETDHSGHYNQIYERQLSNVYSQIWDTILSEAPFISYPEFLSDGSFLDIRFSADFFLGRTSWLGSVELDAARIIDKEKLKTLLSDLKFEKTGTEIVKEAEIGAGSIILLSAGRDNSGRAFIISFDYSAQISDEQLDAFREICSGEVCDAYFNPEATYYIYHQIRDARNDPEPIDPEPIPE